MAKRRSARPLWNNAIKRFCDTWLCAARRSGKTVKAYRIDLKQFVRQLPRTVAPRRVSPERVQIWVARLQKREYAVSSIRRKLASLRAFYVFLVKSGGIGTSPLTGLGIRLGAARRLIRVVPRDDVRKLIQTAQRAARHRIEGKKGNREITAHLREAVIIRLLASTGIRVGELVSLRVRDVQQRDRTLVILGKGNRERLAYLVDDGTHKLLTRYLRQLANSSGEDFLFPGNAGCSISTESVRQMLRRIGSSAETSARVTPHMLRHTAATALLENGADLRVVQEFLGHDSIRSTERYTHVAPKFLRRVLRRANPLKMVA